MICNGLTATRKRCGLEHGHPEECEPRKRKGRPRKEMTGNPFDGPAHVVAAREGVSAPTVLRWRRENPHLRPALTARLGRPATPGDVYAEKLDEKYPGASALCQSDATGVSIALAYGVTRQAVEQWRNKLKRPPAE